MHDDKPPPHGDRLAGESGSVARARARQRFRRLATRTLDAISKPFPLINRFDRQVRRSVREHRREMDPEENERSKPPPDEHVRVHCIWMTEFYGPAELGPLLSRLRRLGW